MAIEAIFPRCKYYSCLLAIRLPESRLSHQKISPSPSVAANDQAAGTPTGVPSNALWFFGARAASLLRDFFYHWASLSFPDTSNDVIFLGGRHAKDEKNFYGRV